MNARSRLLTSASLAFGQRSTSVAEGPAGPVPLPRPRRGRATPVVIGHRGACGYRPEHTREAYRLAAGQGAVSIEPDLVMTGDGILVARHEHELSRSTDVARRPEFAHHRSTKEVAGRPVTGWFTEDFSLAEIRLLNARERHPRIRPTNTYWDARGCGIMTFEEVLDLADALGVGVHAEIKHAAHFTALGLAPAAAVARALGPRRGRAPVTLMSFEPTVLRSLAPLVDAPRIQLLDVAGRPDDLRGTPASLRYRDLATPDGLAAVAEYASGIGVHKDLVLPRDATDLVRGSSALVGRAHRRELQVLVWTIRAENQYLPRQARSSACPTEYGDIRFEVNALARAGVDGILTDHPDLVVEVLATH